MDLTDNESCTIELPRNMRPLRNVKPSRTFTSPPRSTARQKSPVRAKSPSLRGAVHPVGPRAQDFDRTRSIWETRESLASKPSEAGEWLLCLHVMCVGVRIRAYDYAFLALEQSRLPRVSVLPHLLSSS